MKKLFGLLLLLLIVSCTQAPVDKKTIKIGVLADLTGDYASVLRGGNRGAELAAEDLRTQQMPIELIVEDQKSCDNKETVTIVNKFTTLDHVHFIIGGTCSSTTLAAAPIAEASRTVMISPISSAPSVSKAGDYIFRTYISDKFRAAAAAELAYKLGKRKMALLTDISNDAFVELSAGAKPKFEELGGKVVAEEKTDKDTTDLRTQIVKIKEANPDVLMVITGPIGSATAAKQARELGLKVQLMAPVETVEDQQVIDIAGDAVEGLIYVMPGNPPQTLAYQALEAKYKQRYKEDTMPSYVAEAYDGVMLGIKAMQASDGSKEDLKNKLYEVSKAYTGVSGNVTFDSNGDVSKPVMYKQIKNGKFVVYSP